MATTDAEIEVASEAPDETIAAPARKARAVKGVRSELRISDEPCFVLHSYPYKETSLIVDVLTRHHGRIALVARGAKRPRSALRGVLLAFQPLTVGWTGGRSRSSELRTLTRAEWVGGLAPLRGEGLLCGFYLNELLIKLLARDDAHASLFDAYIGSVGALAAGHAAAPVLRGFEYTLLREAGYALDLTHCVDSGEAVEADAWYRYVPEHGPVRIADRGDREGLLLSGRALLDIEAGRFAEPATQTQSKLLMRQLLNHHLAGQILNTRQMMMDLQNL